MANVRQDEDIQAIRIEQASWLIDRLAEAAGVNDLREGARGARADLARKIIQANNGDTEEKTFVDKTIDLIARWGQLRSSKNFGGGAVEGDTLLLFGNAWRAIARGAWLDLPPHKLEQWIDDCLSGARDWHTGEEKGLVAAAAELLELKRSIDTALPPLRATLEGLEALRVSVVTRLGQNAEKGAASPPGFISTTRISIMRYNPAEFGKALSDAIERSGQPIELVRDQFAGKNKKRVTRFNNVLAGEPVQPPLTASEVDQLVDALENTKIQSPVGEVYTLHQLYGLAGALPPGTPCPTD